MLAIEIRLIQHAESFSEQVRRNDINLYTYRHVSPSVKNPPPKVVDGQVPLGNEIHPAT